MIGISWKAPLALLAAMVLTAGTLIVQGLWILAGSVILIGVGWVYLWFAYLEQFYDLESKYEQDVRGASRGYFWSNFRSWDFSGPSKPQPGALDEPEFDPFDAIAIVEVLGPDSYVKLDTERPLRQILDVELSMLRVNRHDARRYYAALNNEGQVVLQDEEHMASGILRTGRHTRESIEHCVEEPAHCSECGRPRECATNRPDPQNHESLISFPETPGPVNTPNQNASHGEVAHKRSEEQKQLPPGSQS
ncbi:hypothetical protein QPX56_03735 [Corynebacterium pseudodiphtheriticum]|uniref:hypothetical protein n=1 Tax=Corynebacterium pseudodiphtheriticum TaxID=37637 RepID=UPI002543EAE1|nr:hypothetical protein [Corynebacterium pseudodiphtheriticum]MDK4327890.1 hypothetical protein [Corynebacterium pseudodiphtheriticum]